ncbi:mast cell protease 3 isoform X1 [Bombyx mori]|uniref:Peptidase S1 domain-containing protein n=1 Tax=Bombyx mori TaxID=7091 RepID=A0A8R1WNB9_BOMMO|nr:mast cell protease 3 isoform X1 [Bombyx mori]
MIYFGFVFTFAFVVILSPQAIAQGENDIKRGTYPYMAFVYYLDNTIVDESGARFLQSAFLIRLDWLVTSSIDVSSPDNNVVGFPTKTLLARVGAVTIDTNFTLNEDEDEQEQEIIQVVRPSNHNASEWWRTDISLLKTIFPFKITTAVNSAYFHLKMETFDKPCFILIFIKESGNFSDDKVLKRTSVELQIPSTKEICGARFTENSMVCAVENDEYKNNTVQDFCLGNSGGPLICHNEVVGVQTYAELNCNPPYLYQLLNQWENFISCGTDDKCHEKECSKHCVSFHKDVKTEQNKPTLTARIDYPKSTEKTFENITATSALPETVTEEGEIEMTPTLTTEATTTEVNTTTRITLPTSEARATTKTSNQKDEIRADSTENLRNSRKRLEHVEEEAKRKVNVEAQKEDKDHKETKIVKLSSAADRNSAIHCYLFGLMFWHFI